MISHYLNAVIPGRVANDSGQRAILLSYYAWRNSRDLPRSPLLVGDSGGFTIATKGVALDPLDVIRWQMKHTAIGYILDRPPYDATTKRGTARLSLELWPGCLRSTVRYVKRALPLYRPLARSFRWWGIVQGATRKQQEEWYGEVAAVYPFDGEGEGWAMRPYPNSNLDSIARCVRFAADRRISRLHLLQTTGAASVAVLLALSKLAGLQFVTFDSATAGRESRFLWLRSRPRHFPIFYGHEVREVSARRETSVRRYMRSGQCPCTGCTGFPSDEELSGTEFVSRLALHNYSVMRDNFDAIAAVAEGEPEKLIRMAAGTRADAVFRAFDGSASS